MVELTVALHYVFDTPRDRLVWDVGHQAYPHKILTGRRSRIRTLRQGGGLSGFTRRAESEYDPFGAAHSSTSISAALGMALAVIIFTILMLLNREDMRDRLDAVEHVVRVTPDGIKGDEYEALVTELATRENACLEPDTPASEAYDLLERLAVDLHHATRRAVGGDGRLRAPVRLPEVSLAGRYALRRCVPQRLQQESGAGG